MAPAQTREGLWGCWKYTTMGCRITWLGLPWPGKLLEVPKFLTNTNTYTYKEKIHIATYKEKMHIPIKKVDLPDYVAVCVSTLKITHCGRHEQFFKIIFLKLDCYI